MARFCSLTGVSLRWLRLAAHHHNHLPYSIISIIHHCVARMQKQQWKENPMEDLCWTVATSAQSVVFCCLRFQSKRIQSFGKKVTSKRVTQLKSIEKYRKSMQECHFVVQNLSKVPDKISTSKSSDQRKCQALLCSRSWPQRMVGQCCKPCQILRKGFCEVRKKNGALKWTLCKWLKMLKPLNTINIYILYIYWIMDD